MTKKSDVLQVEFARLQARHKRLTPDLIVREARASRSPLHRHFPWNDRKAAYLKRLDIARELLSVYVTIEITERRQHFTVPMFIRDPKLPTHVQGYVRTQEVSQREHAEGILKAECLRIEGCIYRAREVAGLLDVRFPGVAMHLEVLLDTVMAARNALARPASVASGARRSAKGIKPSVQPST